jgi:hypothetical protein
MTPQTVLGVCFTFAFDLIGLEIFVVNVAAAGLALSP